MAFHIGQKVARFKGEPGISGEPSIGEVCTISNVYVADQRFLIPGEEMIELVEYPRHENEFFGAGYRAKFFRPVVEDKKKTDISIFTKLLDGTRVPEKV